MRRASAAACSSMKVVAAVSPTSGGAVFGAAAAASEIAGAAGRIGRPRRVGLALLSWRRPQAWACLSVAGWGRGASTGLAVCLTAVLGFGRAAGVGLGGSRGARRGDGFGGRFDRLSCGSGAVVLDEDVLVMADQVVVVVELLVLSPRRGKWGAAGGPWRQAQAPGLMSKEDERAGSGIGCVRALSLLSCVRVGAGTVAGVMCPWWPGGVVSAARVNGFSAGGPLQLQDVLVCLLEIVAGAEEASLDAGHVLFREVGIVFGGGTRAWQQQGHEAGWHHVRAEL